MRRRRFNNAAGRSFHCRLESYRAAARRFTFCTASLAQAPALQVGFEFDRRKSPGILAIKDFPEGTLAGFWKDLGMLIGKRGAATTAISAARSDRVTIRCRDLAVDLIGDTSFTEYFFFVLVLVGRRAREERRDNW